MNWRKFAPAWRNDDGLTLIELMAAIVISVMIGAVLVAVFWASSSRSANLLQYSAAQRQVLLVNHALTRELHTADFVQFQYSGNPGQSDERIVLWLYHGGIVANANPSPSWMYDTNTVLPTAPTNNSAATSIIGATPFGAFVFAEQPNATWTIGYTNQVANSGTACNTTLPNSPPPIGSGLDVEWDFPNAFGQGGTLPTTSSCTFVNSFVIRVAATYTTSAGKRATYALTAGYHDKDVR